MDSDNTDTFKELLKKNRELVHGAFALDDSGKKVIFRDTLQLENLDMNELQGSSSLFIAAWASDWPILNNLLSSPM